MWLLNWNYVWWLIIPTQLARCLVKYQLISANLWKSSANFNFIYVILKFLFMFLWFSSHRVNMLNFSKFIFFFFLQQFHMKRIMMILHIQNVNCYLKLTQNSFFHICGQVLVSVKEFIFSSVTLLKFSNLDHNSMNWVQW